MNNAALFSSIPSLEIVETSPSLRDVAAYLRGVADATAVLSDARPPPLDPLFVGLSESPDRRDTITGCGPASGRTIPYTPESASAAPGRRNTAGYPLPEDPTDKAPAMFNVAGDFIPESWDDVNGGERESGVRLRVDRLSPEWYELLDAGAA